MSPRARVDLVIAASFVLGGSMLIVLIESLAPLSARSTAPGGRYLVEILSIALLVAAAAVVYGWRCSGAARRESGRRRRVERLLATEQERLAVTLGSIEDGVIFTDARGSIVAMNEAAAALTGWAEAEVQGASVDQVLAGPGGAPSSPVAGSPTGEPVLVRERSFVARDGSLKMIRQLTVPLTQPGGAVVGEVIVFNGLSQRRKLEDHLLKADKLEAVGILAGGIAHDFNNVLAGLAINTMLAKMSVAADDPLFDRLQTIEQITLRAQGLTHQLLTFARGGDPVKRPTFLATFLEQAAGFALAGSNVRCEVVLPPDLWPVECDVGQISHVANNLLMNAAESMPEGGTVEVTAGNVIASGQGLLPLTGVRYVRVAVKDHGAGIPRDHFTKIFDPYFTTKVKRSGLGLASVYSIVKKHDGYVDVDSEVGAGSTFTIYLPAADQMPAAEPAAPPPVRALRLLLMDDDEVLRRTGGELLARFGHTVELAADGAEAVERYRAALAAHTPFDLVIMDLTVAGGMGGVEAMRRLLALDPDARAIVSSGYSTDPALADFRKYGFRAVLPKPYRFDEMAQALQDALRDPDER